MTPRRKTTLSDVAKRAGVSLGAASKVLNGGCGKIGVGADTRKRILEAAENLNYKANMAASILAGGHSRLIGVFIDSFTPHRGLRLLQEIERCSVRQGYRIITCFSHDDIAGMKSDYQTLRRYGITDFICCSHDYPRMKDEIRELFSDVENVVFMEKPCLEDRPFVRTSRRKALTDMIAAAYEEGHRRFGLLHTFHTAQTERILREEFRQALRSNGLEPDEKLFFEYPLKPADTVSRVCLAVEHMIRPNKPDFLYVDDAKSAVALRTQLEGSGLKLRMHGGDGDPLFDSMNIASLDPRYEDIASALLKLLLHPETRDTVPVIEAIYKREMRDDPPSLKLRRTRR